MQTIIDHAVLIALTASLAGFIFVWLQRRWVLSQDAGNDFMLKIAHSIRIGSLAFLRRQYRYTVLLVGGASLLLLGLSLIPGSMISPWTSAAFVAGAISSALAGNIGMRMAVQANVRTAAACKVGINQGLRVAFAGGSVMGTAAVALVLFGISILYMVINWLVADPFVAGNALAGFGFGATSIALMARVGGGIYTKGADIGADLVGKTESGIPEDDIRNPAVIADNVGDNVGDVAGMGSDLFESYASSIISAIILSAVLANHHPAGYAQAARVFPFLIGAAGLIIGIISTFAVRTSEDASQADLLKSMRKGTFTAVGLVALAIIALGYLSGLGTGVVLASLSGLVTGIAIGLFTDFYTSAAYGPTRNLAQSAQSGSAIVVIQGLSIGMSSTFYPVLVMILAMIISFAGAGLYGLAIAAVSMLATLNITLASDAYGSIADNAGGIAQMAGLDEVVRQRTDALDSLGNTTAATGKGFAVGSAVLTALALISAFISEINRASVDILDIRLVTGLFLGAMLPFLFSAQIIQSVGKTAQLIVNEVRRQFNEIPGIMEGKADPDYERCVTICTDSAVRGMLFPTAIAVAVPLGVALISKLVEGTVIANYLGPETKVGILVGSLITVCMLALLMANAGGSMDNAKKYIEHGNYGGKGSNAHKAAVVGDTVGDPLKDTAGPSLDILIKLLAIVSLILAPLF